MTSRRTNVREIAAWPVCPHRRKSCFSFSSDLHYFDTCREFAEQFRPASDDVILTNEYIYEPFFGSMKLPSRVIHQEKFGRGEPSDGNCCR